MSDGQGFPEDTEVAVFTRDQFGDEWPFTVDEVFVYCRRLQVEHRKLSIAYFVTSDGRQFALNGIGHGHTGFPTFEEIWAERASGLGLKADPGAVIRAATALCW